MCYRNGITSGCWVGTEGLFSKAKHSESGQQRHLAAVRRKLLLLILFSQELYFQIPEGTQKGGDILWLPFPQSQLWSSQTPTPAHGGVPDRHLHDGHD